MRCAGATMPTQFTLMVQFQFCFWSDRVQLENFFHDLSLSSDLRMLFLALDSHWTLKTRSDWTYQLDPSSNGAAGRVWPRPWLAHWLISVRPPGLPFFSRTTRLRSVIDTPQGRWERHNILPLTLCWELNCENRDIPQQILDWQILLLTKWS